MRDNIRIYETEVNSLVSEGYEVIKVFHALNQIRCYLLHRRNGNRIVITATSLAITLVKNAKIIKVI